MSHPGEPYRVVEVKPGAPLGLNERVKIGKRSAFDLFTGQLLRQEVVREDGSVVELREGCGVLLVHEEDI